jgi:hypothetical protein
MYAPHSFFTFATSASAFSVGSVSRPVVCGALIAQPLLKRVEIVQDEYKPELRKRFRTRRYHIDNDAGWPISSVRAVHTQPFRVPFPARRLTRCPVPLCLHAAVGLVCVHLRRAKYLGRRSADSVYEVV